MTQPTDQFKKHYNKDSLIRVPYAYTIPVPDGESVIITFQSGPVGVKGRNGVTMEDILGVLIDRLTTFQNDTRTACNRNEVALQMMIAARHELKERDAERQAAGISGTLKPLA